MKNGFAFALAMGVATAVVIGCSGGGGGGGTPANVLSGTVGGQTLSMKSGVYVVAGASATNGAFGQLVYAAMSDDPDLCTNITNARFKASSHFFFFDIGQNFPSSSPPFEPPIVGSYSIWGGTGPFPTDFFLGTLSTLDGSCNTTATEGLASGTVNLSAVTPDVKGSGTGLSTNSGDSIGLTFDFQPCPGLASFLTATTVGCAP